MTAAGVFTASSQSGTFLVRATSVVDASIFGSANVTVAAAHVLATGTVVSTGNVTTQTWALAGSPFRVQGDITVPAGSTLTIQPGVVVMFMGHHRMTVVGALDARGTSAAPILFTAADIVVGWYGLRIWSPAGPGGASPGHQYVEHCILEHSVKFGDNDVWYNDSRGALFVDSNSGPQLHIHHNVFRNNRSVGKGAALMLGSISGVWQMTGNVFENNHATDQGGAMDLKHSTGMLTLSGGSFSGNHTSATTTQPNSVRGAGGAVVIFNDSQLTLMGVGFSGNMPDDWAGVVPVVIGSAALPAAAKGSPGQQSARDGGMDATDASHAA